MDLHPVSLRAASELGEASELIVRKRVGTAIIITGVCGKNAWRGHLGRRGTRGEEDTRNRHIILRRRGRVGTWALGGAEAGGWRERIAWATADN